MPVVLHPPGFRARFAEIAKSQIGVREVGKNGGKQVREYQRKTYLDLGPWPWCAAFVCWCYELTARELCPALLSTRPTTPRAFDFEKWGSARAHVRADFSAILLGDIVIFEFSHVGISIGVSGQSVTCVEGNTDGLGTREGEGVFLKTRPFSSIRSFVRLSESTTPQGL